MPTIAFDNETFLITRSNPAPKLVCTSFFDGVSVLLLKHGPRLWSWFRRLLLDPEIHFVNMNIAYDFATLAASCPDLLPLIFDAYRAGRVTDIGIRQQLFDIAHGRQWGDDAPPSYSLALLWKLIFDEDISKEKGLDTWRMRYAELYDVPLQDWPAEALDYPKRDAKRAYAIWAKQKENIKDLLRDDAFQSYAAFVLTLISMRGMICDPVAVEKLRITCETKVAELRPRLLENKLLHYDKKQDRYAKKQKIAQERILHACQAQGVKPFLTKKGRALKKAGKPYDDLKYITTDRAACYWSRDVLMIDRADYSNAEKLLTTYYPFLLEGTRGPITTRFKMVSTGRTSSSTPSPPLVGGNFQNMPRDPGPRECIIPRPGYVFLAADFSGAELHALAQVCKWRLGYSVLGDVLNAGQDVHLFLAAHLLDISYAEALERYKNDGEIVIEARQQAKPANFGFAGYMFENRFIQEQLKYDKVWEFSKVRKLRQTWLRAFPEMAPYFENCKLELGPKGSTLIELYMSKRLRKVAGLPMCCNSWFQSLVADGTKDAICEVTRECYAVRESALYDCRPVNFVHDELIMEVVDDPNLWPAVIARFIEIMTERFNKYVPDYPTNVDVVLMRRWSKKAKPVFDAQGNLMPWDWD